MLNCRFICLFSRLGTRLNLKKTSWKMLDFNKICFLIHTINNVNGYFSIFKTKQTTPDQRLLTSDTRCERDWQMWSVFQFHFASVVKLHDSNHPTLWHLTHRGKLVNFCTRSSATREKSDFLSLEQHAGLSLEVIGTFLNFTLSSINPSFVFFLTFGWKTNLQQMLFKTLFPEANSSCCRENECMLLTWVQNLWLPGVWRAFKDCDCI